VEKEKTRTAGGVEKHPCLRTLKETQIKEMIGQKVEKGKGTSSWDD